MSSPVDAPQRRVIKVCTFAGQATQMRVYNAGGSYIDHPEDPERHVGAGNCYTHPSGGLGYGITHYRLWVRAAGLPNGLSPAQTPPVAPAETRAGCARADQRKTCFPKTLDYMWRELTRNARSRYVEIIREHNGCAPPTSASCAVLRGIAASMWASRVRNHAVWDHKPTSRRSSSGWTRSSSPVRVTRTTPCSRSSDVYAPTPRVSRRG